MNSLALIQYWYYPCVMRVVMNKKITYWVTVLASTKRQPSLDIGDLRSVFGITKDEDWEISDIRGWRDALSELGRKVRCHPESRRINAEGVFITIRPKHGDMTISSLTVPS